MTAVRSFFLGRGTEKMEQRKKKRWELNGAERQRKQDGLHEGKDDIACASQ